MPRRWRPRPKVVTGSFSVDTSSREQVREFYRAVYTSSDGVPNNSTAVTAACIPGTNSPLFASVTLRRINWFRALAGIPAALTFDAGEGWCGLDADSVRLTCRGLFSQADHVAVVSRGRQDLPAE